MEDPEFKVDILELGVVSLIAGKHSNIHYADSQAFIRGHGNIHYTNSQAFITWTLKHSLHKQSSIHYADMETFITQTVKHADIPG